MSRYDAGSPHRRDRSRRQRSWMGRWLVPLFLLVFLSNTFLSDWGGTSIAHAAAAKNPNPPLSPPAWLKAPKPAKGPDLGKYVTGHPSTAQQHLQPPKRGISSPVTFLLTPAAKRVLSHDQHLEINVAAGTITAQQVHAAGGAIHVKIVQLDAGSGGFQSGQILLGTYQILLQDAKGHPLTTLVLAHPLSLHYHLLSSQKSLLWKNQVVYTSWTQDGSSSTTSASTTNTQSAAAQAAPAAHAPTFEVMTKQSAPALTWSAQTTLTNQATSSTPASKTAATSKTQAAASPTVMAAASSSTVTFSTQAPQASWGTAQTSDVGLSSGSLEYTYPLSLPPGPGGFTPPISLHYSSGSVAESHNIQATAPWVGEGWSLGLGSITWNQENVTPGGTNNMENVWMITDPSGVSGQLILPDINLTTTAATDSTTNSIWHSAPESHGKIQEVNFNGEPCWHVWEPNGVLEEFGCTNDSRQSATDAAGAFVPYRWDLDLMVDRYGNQIHVTYQQDRPTNDVQDSTISTITYDDPSCHQTTFNGATAACSSWNPQVKLIFNARTNADRVTNGGSCQTWPATTGSRCDSPLDLSSSGGAQKPKAYNSYVLNNLQVDSQGSLLREYLFSYDQGGPQTVTDAIGGQSISAAGYLNLTQIQELGTNGSSANAPMVSISYTKQPEHFISSDATHPAQPSTNCPSWDPTLTSGCWLWQQTYNDYYIQTFDNGQGWHETINWAEAHNNTHGTDSGAANNALTCNSGNSKANNLCEQADDRSWSRIVVYNRSDTTNGITSTWQYQYYLSSRPSFVATVAMAIPGAIVTTMTMRTTTTASLPVSRRSWSPSRMAPIRNMIFIRRLAGAWQKVALLVTGRKIVTGIRPVAWPPIGIPIQGSPGNPNRHSFMGWMDHC